MIAIVAANYQQAWDYLNAGGMEAADWVIVTSLDAFPQVSLDGAVYLGGPEGVRHAVWALLDASVAASA